MTSVIGLLIPHLTGLSTVYFLSELRPTELESSHSALISLIKLDFQVYLPRGKAEKMARDEGGGETEDREVSKKKARGGFLGLMSRIWNGMFRFRGQWDDFEKRLQHISKEEAALLSRMKRRSHTWRRMARHLILFSVFFEVSSETTIV